MPADGMKPRCALEQFALDIFHHHVPKELDYDVSLSGAEWWCQLRPNPEKTGRYSMHCPNDDPEGVNDPFSQGISIHWDKDEELRILTGGTTYIHPHLSTVTYLTSFGSPTMIMNCRVHPLQGTYLFPDDTVEGFVSWPATGKHTSFDGRFLHAAPCDLMEEGLFEKQMHFDEKSNDEKFNKIQRRRHRRVTFLVNIWLNYRPFDVQPFPETMIDKMSGLDDSTRQKLIFFPTPTAAGSPSFIALGVKDTTVKSTIAIENNEEATAYNAKEFTWSMGDANSTERLRIQMPLHTIHKEASNGANICIKWDVIPKDGDNPCFQLIDTHSLGPHKCAQEPLAQKPDGSDPPETKRARVD
jgi:hypothetical protein